NQNQNHHHHHQNQNQKTTTGDKPPTWESVKLEGHESAIIAIDGVQIDNGLVVVTAATDGTVRVWAEDGRMLQVIKAGALAVALAVMPGDNALVLATGNTDNRVHMYVRAPTGEFVEQAVLGGHDDWVTALAFHRVTVEHRGNSAIGHWARGNVVLASASQDRYVRLWRISPAAAAAEKAETGDSMQAVLDACSANLGSADIAAQLATKAYSLGPAPRQARSISLDSVLVGHDGWVHSVAWVAPGHLLTASGDGSAMLWAPDAEAGVWSSAARLGEVGGGIGFLGARALGTTGVLAHGYQGSLHRWQLAPAGPGGRWAPLAAPSGHFGAARDVCWTPCGHGILSASSDQTTRLFAHGSGGLGAWFEVARPQIHGYDLRCAQFRTAAEYVSGAEEKVVRVFRATQHFARGWAALTGHELADAGDLPLGASLPVLGLSNKAVVGAAGDAVVAANDTYAVRQTHTDVAAQALASARVGAPLEEDLMRLTLWPEADKLYAHAYEIYAVACAPGAGRWVATACRATAEKHASVRLYDVASGWTQPAVLVAHSLTVTRLRFSGCGRWLLSVSRDRSWALHHRARDEGGFVLRALRRKAHLRIIWDAAWAPEGGFFATASRDKTVKLWALAGLEEAVPVVLAFPEPVTAVDFVPRRVGGEYVLAVALESGRVFVLRSAASAGAGLAPGAVPTKWTPNEVPRDMAHTDVVNRLAWSPLALTEGADKCCSWLLASASDDHTVRVNQADWAKEANP
ncbi:Elongator subunit elp2, partial [Kickxella alabastrina]